MKSLPEYPFELSSWKKATVQLNYHIQVDKMNYLNILLSSLPGKKRLYSLTTTYRSIR